MENIRIVEQKGREVVENGEKVGSILQWWYNFTIGSSGPNITLEVNQYGNLRAVADE